MPIRRRTMLSTLAALPIAGISLTSWASTDAQAELRQLERRIGGRIGLAAVDTGSGRTLRYRADEPFTMQSVFKWLLAACVLYRAEHGGPSLDDAVTIPARAITVHSDESRPFIGMEMTVGALCAAMMSTSDNGAANTLLGAIGGPAYLTAWLRGVGDPITRQDDYEPEQTRDALRDPRDSTTPAAMLATMRRLLLGDVLSTAARTQLLVWLRSSVVGAHRLRAGLPVGWIEGDRSGTGDPGIINDIAILWPQGVHGHRAPVLVAAFLEGSSREMPDLEAAQARIGRLVSGSFQI